MNIFRSLAGVILIEITSADVTVLLDLLCRKGIELWDLNYQNELTVRFRVSRLSFRKLEEILSKRGVSCREISHEGMFWCFQSLLSRTVLLFGMLLLMAAVILLPGKIFFVRVEGNSQVPGNQILETASQLGIKFGASRHLVRSELIKNGLLAAIEELEWAGVTTKGCVAIISVREQPSTDDSFFYGSVGDVVALRDGIVVSCDVTRGMGVCSPGQAVKTGQILISGTVDHGIAITSTTAKGEIFAATDREVIALADTKTQIRGIGREQKANYSLLIGKKLINFFKGSGISGGTCVKMYSKYVLSLPGGFSLPVALIKWTILSADLVTEEIPVDDARRMLSDFSIRYLDEQMIAGRIVQKNELLTHSEGLYQLKGNYACIEMIGRVQQEQIGANHGKTD